MKPVIRFIESIFGPLPHQRGSLDSHVNYCASAAGRSGRLELQKVRSSELCEKSGVDTTRICFISDSHGLHGLIDALPPSCDLLVFCGDMFFKGRTCTNEEGLNTLVDFNNWVKKFNIKTIVIGGNHDYHIEKFGRERVKEILSNCIYLMNESVTIRNINIYGTPYSAPGSLNRAFQDENTRNQAIEDINSNKYDLVVSHSNQIYKWVKMLPKVCAFGHFHRMYGAYQQSGDEGAASNDTALFICSSILDANYCLTNHPIVYDLQSV